MLDLATGEPEHLHSVALLGAQRTSQTLVEWGYPKTGGCDALKAKLREFQPQYKYHVVTVGARQALAAAAEAIREYNRPNARYLHHQAPYWPGHPEVAAAVGLEGGDFRQADFADKITVVTSPNNPDHRIEPDGKGSFAHYDIWDAAYAHDLYGWDGSVPNHDIAVFSASKLFGASHARIGWAATNSKAHYELMCEHVDRTTSGVSTLDQAYLMGLLETLPQEYFPAREILRDNSSKLLELHTHTQHGSLTVAGMFAWFQPKNYELFSRALDWAKVKLLRGEDCGMPSDSGWYRMSLGKHPADFAAAVNGIAEVLKALSCPG